jgi:hypothetical protein
MATVYTLIYIAASFHNPLAAPAVLGNYASELACKNASTTLLVASKVGDSNTSRFVCINSNTGQKVN